MFVCSAPANCAGLHGKGTMPTDVVMPQMGESIFEGTITKWLKKAGDKVQRDEPLFEISTDKVDAEIPAPPRAARAPPPPLLPPPGQKNRPPPPPPLPSAFLRPRVPAMKKIPTSAPRRW